MGRDAIAGGHLGGMCIERRHLVNAEPHTCLDHLGQSRKARTMCESAQGQNSESMGGGALGVLHALLKRHRTPLYPALLPASYLASWGASCPLGEPATEEPATAGGASYLGSQLPAGEPAIWGSHSEGVIHATTSPLGRPAGRTPPAGRSAAGCLQLPGVAAG